MKCAVLFAARDISRRYAFDVRGHRFDIRNNGYLDDRVLRIVSLKLVAGFEGTALVRGVKLYENGTNLTRLDDFFEVKVAWLTSARSASPRCNASNQVFAARTPDPGRDGMILHYWC